MSKDIIILGSGPSHGMCPYNRETWGVNIVINFPQFRAKAGNKIFFFDSLETFNADILSINNLIETQGLIEAVTTADNARIMSTYNLKATIYPLETVIQQLKANYFANSLAYMVAYAIFTGVKSIHLYGVDHLSYQTYIMERSCLEYWLGRAQGAGIDISIAEDSAVLKTYNRKLYGYDFIYNEHTKPDEDFVLCEDTMIK